MVIFVNYYYLPNFYKLNICKLFTLLIILLC